MNLIKPMLCKTGSMEDLKKENYIYELKLDGTRAILYKKSDRINIYNRRNVEISKRYPEIVNEALKIKSDFILDGEIVVFDQKGLPNFHYLQMREHLNSELLIKIRTSIFPANYIIFDIIQFKEDLLLKNKLIKRKEILKENIEEKDHIKKCPFFSQGHSLWEIVKKKNLEGVIAKDLESFYFPGKRKHYWLKIKNFKTIDCIIIGYSQKKRELSSLALGLFFKDKLKYIGKVSASFPPTFSTWLLEKLKKLHIEDVEYTDMKIKDIKWVKPFYICEVKYLELLENNILRSPSFLRLRNDKSLKECNSNFLI